MTVLVLDAAFAVRAARQAAMHDRDTVTAFGYCPSLTDGGRQGKCRDGDSLMIIRVRTRTAMTNALLTWIVPCMMSNELMMSDE